jgi:hypothetical protein
MLPASISSPVLCQLQYEDGRCASPLQTRPKQTNKEQESHASSLPIWDEHPDSWLKRRRLLFEAEGFRRWYSGEPDHEGKTGQATTLTKSSQLLGPL